MTAPYYVAPYPFKGPRGGRIYGWTVRSTRPGNFNWCNGTYRKKSEAITAAAALNDVHERSNF